MSGRAMTAPIDPLMRELEHRSQSVARNQQMSWWRCNTMVVVESIDAYARVILVDLPEDVQCRDQ